MLQPHDVLLLVPEVRVLAMQTRLVAGFFEARDGDSLLGYARELALEEARLDAQGVLPTPSLEPQEVGSLRNHAL